MKEDMKEPQDAITEIEQVEAVEPQVDVEQVIVQEEERESQTKVPLSALQKERRKRQELELELQWERQRAQKAPAPVEEDNSRYESATREDLSKAQDEAVRIIEEKLWIKQNPEKYEQINEYLPQFLKQRPNLVSAINSASNRYEEAYTLMDALTPKQQQQMKTAVVQKKVAPNAPSGVPKAASLNQSIDVMSMSDTEFVAWRKTKRSGR